MIVKIVRAGEPRVWNIFESNKVSITMKGDSIDIYIDDRITERAYKNDTVYLMNNQGKTVDTYGITLPSEEHKLISK